MEPTMETVLIIGGTGAQGVSVVKALTSYSRYAVRVITRNASSKDAIILTPIPGVTIFEGNAYDEPKLREAFKDIYYVFFYTNGFALVKCQKSTGVFVYELAREFGVKHFVYAALEYASNLGNFERKYRCGHVDGERQSCRLHHCATINSHGLDHSDLLHVYGMAFRISPALPDHEDPNILVFAAPLGEGKYPPIHTEEDIAWKDLTADFSTVTGRKAVYKDITLDDCENHTLLTFRDNFSGFWNMWKDDLTKRDYKLLDEILPTRVKSVREWMMRQGIRGIPHQSSKTTGTGPAAEMLPSDEHS
ncbi:NAD(P)-binding protein [Trichoderma barbatum]